MEGELTLVTDRGAEILTPGMAAGFPAGEANGHHLVNRSSVVAIYLEVGDRTPNDKVTYPDENLMTTASPDGKSRKLIRNDGTPY